MKINQNMKYSPWPFKNTLPVTSTPLETFAKHQYCHCERSEAISQDLDNPQDCFVASLLAMTKTAVMQRSPLALLFLALLAFLLIPSLAQAGCTHNNNKYSIYCTYTDTTAPTITGFNPADDSTGIAIDANLVITFRRSLTPSARVLWRTAGMRSLLRFNIVSNVPYDHQHVEIKDIFIASIAIYNEVWLRTFNEKHFKGIEELKMT
jgi:hypothetical protein